jgi:dihydroorotate dehydrogenase (NAD+) catalytic subunit
VAAVGVVLAGIRLRNPFLLASGIWGESGESLKGAYAAGAAGAVTKSIGAEPRPGYPNPTVESYGTWGMLNAMGLPNPGIGEYPREIAIARDAGVPLIGSVFAGDAVVRAVVRAVKLPVFAKLTPNSADVVALGLAAERGGAAAVTAINTLRALAIDVDLRRPVLANRLGGLSGPAVKPVGLAIVWQLYEALRIPVVGVGGISTVDDAIEYALAGARAVEVGTAVAFDGVRVFGTLAGSLSARLDALGFASWEEAVGAAHATKDGGSATPTARE